MTMPTGQSTYFDSDIYFNNSNPFRGGLIGQCTWYCWSKAHAKAASYPERNLDVSHLPTCAAGRWGTVARSNGYTVSSTPKNDCIAVWPGGHVAYVELYDSATQEVCFSEANWYKDTNPSYEIVVPEAVRATIAANVARLASNVTVKSKTNGQAGTDGAFKTMSLSRFIARKSGGCEFIYLN